MRIEAPRGTHDVLASDWPHWELIEREAERLCALYGYARITTPTFEDTDLFSRTSGAGSDVVQKEMYTFSDRSDRSITLRPEATAPIARAYLEHGLYRDPQPVKHFTIAPMFRYSAPQRGRYREHWQLSVEAIGSSDPAIDAEVVQLYAELLRALGVSEWTLLLNSIGDENCRPAYLERLTGWLDDHAESLGEEVREKRATSPLRVFDVTDAAAQEALAGAPKIGESLCAECAAHFAHVRAVLDGYGVPYELAPTLVRGLDYYTRTTWEFVGPEGGAQSSLSGGGRYDGLVAEIGGPPTPGVGFGAGLERLHLAVGARQGPARELDVFLAFEDPGRRMELLPLLARLRAEGRTADTDYAGRSLKGQLTQARRLGSRVTIIAGSDRLTVRRRGEEDAEVTTLEEALELL